MTPAFIDINPLYIKPSCCKIARDSQTDVQKGKRADTTEDIVNKKAQDNIKGRNGGLGRISRGDLEIRVCVRISRVALTEDAIAMQVLGTGTMNPISLDTSTGYFADRAARFMDA